MTNKQPPLNLVAGLVWRFSLAVLHVSLLLLPPSLLLSGDRCAAVAWLSRAVPEAGRRITSCSPVEWHGLTQGLDVESGVPN